MGDVKKLIGTDNEGIALGVAHNCIETGIDLNLIDFLPEIFRIYSEGMNKINLQIIANCLSKYLHLENDKILKELQFFVNFLSPEHLSSIDQVVDGLAIPLIKIKFGKTVGSSSVKQILLSAKEITKKKFINFLDEAVEKMKIDFADLVQI